MMFPRWMMKGTAAVFSTGLLLVVVGCSSDDGLDTRYPVSGTVTYKGANVPFGTISFKSSDVAKHGAEGKINDGKYTLGTLKEGDGAFPGKYTVTIESLEVDLSEVKAFVKSKGGDPEGQLPQEMVNKARAKGKSNIPTKYNSPATTPLKDREVSSSTPTIDFALED